MCKIVFVALLATATSALAERPIKTPSGQPESIFYQTTAAETGAKLASQCMDLGWQVANQSTNQVTCEVPMGMWKSVLTQMLIGNSYSTSPKTYIAVNIVQVGNNVRAQARAWAETQMAFGQMRQHQYADDNTFTSLVGFLGKAGGELPEGTTFTGNYMGFDHDPATANTSGLTVTQVFPTSPAHVAGMKVGDQVVKVDGKGFKNQADFAKKLNRVKSASYDVLVRRGGQEVKLTLQRMTRPPVGSASWKILTGKAPEATAAAIATPAPTPSSATTTPVVSPAAAEAPTTTAEAPKP